MQDIFYDDNCRALSRLANRFQNEIAETKSSQRNSKQILATVDFQNVTFIQNHDKNALQSYQEVSDLSKTI